MARLSGFLTGQMANPGYMGQLGGTIRSGMQTIGDAYAAKRRRHAHESINAMLSSGDPTDPNVIQSVQAVGQQTGQDPNEVQQMVYAAQANKRQQEEALRSAERFRMQKVLHDYNMELRAKSTQERKAVERAMRRLSENPGDVDKALKGTNPEHIPAVQDALNRHLMYQSNVQKYKDQMQERTPFTSEFLDVVRKTPGMENALEIYEAGPTAPGAKGRLWSAWSQAHNRNLFEQNKEDAMKEWEYKAAMKLIEAYDESETSWGRFWRGVDERDKVGLAFALVQESRDEKEPMSLDMLESIIGGAEGGDDDIDVDQRSDGVYLPQTRAEAESLPSGSRFLNPATGEVITKR